MIEAKEKCDIKEIRSEVERLLHKYRVYKRMRKINNITSNIKITPSYEPREYGNTNSISKPVESLVIREMDAAEERENFIGLVDNCLEQLEGLKQEIFKERYTKSDFVTDTYVQEVILGISGLLYRKTRDAAIREMAFYLGITNDFVE